MLGDVVPRRGRPGGAGRCVRTLPLLCAEAGGRVCGLSPRLVGVPQAEAAGVSARCA